LGTFREHIKISAKESLGYHELKKHKPWFNKGCLKLLDKRKKQKETLWLWFQKQTILTEVAAH
jgi:hypothetical protein